MEINVDKNILDNLMFPIELTGLQERIEKIFRSLIKMIDIDNCILFERIGSVQFNLNFDRILLYMMEGLNTGHSSSRIKLSNVNEELVRFGE